MRYLRNLSHSCSHLFVFALMLAGCTASQGGAAGPADTGHANAPIQEATCPAVPKDLEREDLSKIGGLEHLRGSTGPQHVLIAIKDPPEIGDLPECDVSSTGDRDCSAREAALDAVNQQGLVMQRCVREMIKVEGGVASEDTVFGQIFEAELTWQQVRLVARHPDVLHIDWADAPAVAN